MTCDSSGPTEPPAWPKPRPPPRPRNAIGANFGPSRVLDAGFHFIRFFLSVNGHKPKKEMSRVISWGRMINLRSPSKPADSRRQQMLQERISTSSDLVYVRRRSRHSEISEEPCESNAAATLVAYFQDQRPAIRDFQSE